MGTTQKSNYFGSSHHTTYLNFLQKCLSNVGETVEDLGHCYTFYGLVLG